MKCPNCTGDLHQEDYKGVLVDRCDTCRGLWFDYHELDQLEDTEFSLDDYKNTMITKVRPGDQKCARCHETMQKFSYRWEDLELEVCPNKHGFWLDAGEEEKVLRFIDEFENTLYKKLIHEENWERKKRNMKSDSWLAEINFWLRDEGDFVGDNIRDVIEDLQPENR